MPLYHLSAYIHFKKKKKGIFVFSFHQTPFPKNSHLKRCLSGRAGPGIAGSIAIYSSCCFFSWSGVRYVASSWSSGCACGPCSGRQRASGACWWGERSAGWACRMSESHAAPTCLEHPWQVTSACGECWNPVGFTQEGSWNPISPFIKLVPLAGDLNSTREQIAPRAAGCLLLCPSCCYISLFSFGRLRCSAL